MTLIRPIVTGDEAGGGRLHGVLLLSAVELCGAEEKAEAGQEEETFRRKKRFTMLLIDQFLRLYSKR